MTVTPPENPSKTPNLEKSGHSPESPESPDSSESGRPRPGGFAYWVAIFGGSGLFPVAPGTAGTVASLLLWAPMLWIGVPWWARLLAALGIFALGVWASERAANLLGKDDPKEVVIDEVAGQGVALILAGPSWISLALGFLLFRLFDIWKPWPVGWADKKLHGGWGIMTDDMIAGAYALALLWAWEVHLAPLVLG
jgi:phosphatidylglycerophosphatase A